ncbi:hypothetical protein [Gorillibacterium massiliense]|uniref:hypothetical protein n=1 Tax=Gorillibacterium massiliense TaxID=1280390 RepID=UPI0004ACCD09|nr:hypothetical protein [Gorillibacterium massiliense]
MAHDTEDEVRNQLDEAGDSLAEKKKIESGVDIEPEGDEWVAKPAALINPDELDEP